MNDSVFYESSGSYHGLDADQLEKCMAEQFKIEDMMQIKVKNITVSDDWVDDHTLRYRALLDNIFEQCKQEITKALQIKLEGLRQDICQTPRTTNIYPFLILLPPEELAAFTLDELRRILEGSELYTSTMLEMSVNLGHRIFARYRMRACEQNGVAAKVRKNYKTFVDILSTGKCSDVPRQLWQRIIHHTRSDGPCITAHEIGWPEDVKRNIGRFLLDILLSNVEIDANILSRAKSKKPKREKVLFSIFRTRDLMSRQELRANEVIKQIFDEAKVDTITFNTNEIPMVCYPLPWISTKHGGYVLTPSSLMRLPPSSPIHLMDDVPGQQLYPSLDALNQLGCVPWRINTRILDLAISIFKKGGDEMLSIPLTPDGLLTDEQLAYRGMTRAELKAKIASTDESYADHQRDLNSLFHDTVYKLSLANHYRDRVFWLPHNMDFRGRVYPIPPHLTHLSADLTRSMLWFHQKQPLGELGLERLKLHCINLTGNKKRASIDERLAYANEILDDILDSADNPFDGKRWWLDSDDPWQTLAACAEIADAIRSPDPEQFMSGFPIHQDGSCNGLQHYAALGRDTEGAISVNLSVSERPQDVYSTLADLVEKKRQQDAQADNESSEIASALAGYIDRKVVKQTVMTSVYGVTQMGAFLQIRKQLKAKEYSEENMKEATKYLTKSTLNGLAEMFQSARQIQDWLTNVAKLSAKEKQVCWTTALGLPIIQPYAVDMKKARLKSSTLERQRALYRRKQATAFPPNFVHSLDSTHMMLTALNCHRAGLTFVSVHDCFWTHANKVPEMSRICRDQFVSFHSQPILDDLAQSFLDQQFG